MSGALRPCDSSPCNATHHHVARGAQGAPAGLSVGLRADRRVARFEQPHRAAQAVRRPSRVEVVGGRPAPRSTREHSDRIEQTLVSSQPSTLELSTFIFRFWVLHPRNWRTCNKRGAAFGAARRSSSSRVPMPRGRHDHPGADCLTVRRARACAASRSVGVRLVCVGIQLR
jgi:hypothetical protein